jgi:hypothetical protein
MKGVFMKIIHHYLVAAILLSLFVAGNVFGQHEKSLTTTTSGYPYITEIIMGDTLANGARADSLRVYVIDRGTNWLFDNVIYNHGWDLRIKAKDGAGTKPIIYGHVQTGTTNVPIDFVDAGGNVWLKNIVVNGVYDLDTSYSAPNYSHYGPRELVVYNLPGNFSMVVDSCIFLGAYQANLRTFQAMRSIIVTNCIFGNCGQMVVNGTGNGRALDIRNVGIDTVVMVNNTFTNGYDRVFRHIGSVARLANFRFEHNTIVEFAGRYGIMALGKLGGAVGSIPGHVTIRNNLFVDAMAFGADTNLNRQYDFMEDGEAFSSTILTRVNQVMIFHQLEDTVTASTFNITKNYKYTTPAITNTWATLRSNGWMPIIREASPLTNYIWSKVADSVNAFITLTSSPTFTNVPNPMTGTVLWNDEPAPGGPGGGTSGGTDFKDYDVRKTGYYRDTLNAGYSTSSAAYTGTTDGFPAGDLNWFPSKHAAWLLTGVATQTTSTPNKFALSQNYPNPFNPSTQISYVLAATGSTTLKIYNIIGQEVATLVNSVETAGSHEVKFDASRLSSGVYFYTLRSGNSIATMKMLLMK